FVNADPPSASQQLEFLTKVERLLSSGSFTATYKFALLIALANIAVARGDDSEVELRVDLDELGGEFARLYWRAPRPFGSLDAPLRQARTDGEAAIIGIVAPLAGKTGWSYSRVRLYPAEAAAVITDVRKLVCRYPLYHLQEVRSSHAASDGQDDFLYSKPSANEADRMSRTSITLKPGVGACLRRLHGVVVRLCESEWARWLRKANQQLGADARLEDEMFGCERTALDSYVGPLRDLQQGRCFYSGERLRSEDQVHVDHFIPWSMFSFDSPANLVLVKPEVNASKAASLASVPFLEQMLARNDDSTDALARMGADAGDFAKFRAVARWAYGTAETCGWLDWDWSRRGDRLPFDGSWRRCLAG
ncbi:MAG: HNH endonuclease domain-containing protein, partial [Planctomycetota bacterium]